jgi:hypothetical protein
MGKWIVIRPLSSGSYGRVSLVSHSETGESAAAKELWRTPYNEASVSREVHMAEYLQKFKHVGFNVAHERIEAHIT